MVWEVKVLSTPEEQSLGVKQFVFPLPPNFLLFFPFISPGGFVHMHGVSEPLYIIFLDDNMQNINSGLMMPEGEMANPPGSRHLVEVSAQAAPPYNFEFLRQYI